MIKFVTRAGAMALALGLTNSSPGVAQMGSQQNFVVISIDGARNAGPTTFDIVMTLQNGSKLSLRFNAETIQELTRQLDQIVIMD